MIKGLLLTTFFILSLLFCNAQYKEDSIGLHLQKLAATIQTDTTEIGRYEADSIFTIQLVKTLKLPYSFNYHFDSLTSVQQIVSPDSVFKIFSWQLDLGNGMYKQRAAIQMNTEDGNLKLLPFFDKSDNYETPENAILSRKNWMGAIYYDIALTTFNGINYYSLLGFDEYNATVSRKIIEVIHFEQNEPILGGNYFVYPNDDTYPIPPIERFVYAYKKGSNGYIRYDKENQKIILSELTSISNNLKDKSTLVPSGNEVYFIWSNGKWYMPNK
jgi:hypothetical protein